MMENDNKRKRPNHPKEASDAPAAKKAALALDDRQRERLRGDIRTLYERYEALIHQTSDRADEAAFQALLDAAQGAFACPGATTAAPLRLRVVRSVAMCPAAVTLDTE